MAGRHVGFRLLTKLVVCSVVLVSVMTAAGAGMGVSARPDAGGPWRRYQPTGTNVTDLSVVSAGDAWAVGSDGLFAHWDGSSWATIDNTKVIGAAQVYSVDAARPIAAMQT